MSKVPMGKRSMIRPEDMTRFIDFTPNPALDRVSPDGKAHYIHRSSYRSKERLIYRTREKRGRHPMTVQVGHEKTPHGNLLALSASYPNHYPTWDELHRLRDTFFPDDVAVHMLFPEKETPYINDHPFALWIWEMPEKWRWPSTSPEQAMKELGISVVDRL